MTTEIVSTQTGEITEVRNVNDSKIAGQVLAYMETKEKKVFFGGKRYPEIDDSIFAGSLFGLKTSSSSEYVEVGSEKGFKASAKVLNEKGEVVGGAEAYCLNGEPNWARKPMFQLSGMAQTRAVNRALLNLLKPVFRLAGVESSPAEEMIEDRPVVTMPKAVQKPTQALPVATEAAKKPGVISDAQRRLLFAKTKSAGIDQEAFKTYLSETFKVEHTADLPWTAMKDVLAWIDSQGDEQNIPFGTAE